MSDRRQAPKEARERAFARYGGRCGYCGRKEGVMETDHMTPVAKGGTHEESNLMPACHACNTLKRNRTLEEYRDLLRSLPANLIGGRNGLSAIEKRLRAATDPGIDFGIRLLARRWREMAEDLDRLMSERSVSFYFETHEAVR